MRKKYLRNGTTDIYIDLSETSYHDPETQKWLWEECNVIYSGLNTSPIMDSSLGIIIGKEDDGHIWFDSDSPTFSLVYFKSFLRDGQRLVKTLEKQSK